MPPSPPVPNITVHQLDQEIVLTWDRFSEDYQAIDRVSVDEEGNPTYYTFQGYNIYQLNTPNITPQTTITRLATYDLADGVKEIRDFVFSEEFGENVEATVQKGTDSGLTNHFRITADATRGGISLKNWQTYWFAITAYGYNPNGVPKTLESPTQTVEARPMPLQGGVSANSAYNDLIAFARPDTSHNATHTSAGAVSDGSVEVTVVDPAQVTGADYEVSFELKEGEVVWHLDRIDAGVKTRVLADQTNQSGDGAYLATDGLIVKILGPTPGINTNIPGPFGDIPGYNGWSSAGTRWVSWGTDWGGQTWAGSLGNGAGFFGSTLTAPDYVDVKLTWAGNTQENEPDRWSKGYLYRRDQGYGYAGLGDVPLSAWDNTNPASPRRLNVCFVEMNPMAAANNPDVSVEANAVWDMGWHEVPKDTGFATLGGREYLFIMRSDYDPSGNAYNDDNWGPGADVLYAMWPGPRGTNPYLAGDWEMEIFASKVNYVNDKFAFSTAGLSATSTQASAKTAAQKVNIFPNPYFGNNLMETNPIERFVTITHLPERGATIRIFSLAGDLVRTLNDADREAQGTLDTHVARWDLRNEFDVPVASAVYIIHVDMGTLGEKVLKAAVFMPEERLDKF